MKKRVLAIFFSALMVIQIAGCGNSDKNNIKNNSKNKVESTENSKENKIENTKKDDSSENTTDDENTSNNINTYTDNDNDGKLDISDLYGEWSVEGLAFKSNVYAMTDDVVNTYIGNCIIISDNECSIFDNDITNVIYRLSAITSSEFDKTYNTNIESAGYGNKDITIIEIIKDDKSQGELMAYDRNTIFYYLDGVALKLSRI